MKKENIIADKSLAFAIRIVNTYKYLKEKKEFVLSKQLLRSGTSIGANIQESQGGFSKSDFRYKISIAYKESLETMYWLRLLKATEYLDSNQSNSLQKDADELCRILCSILKSTSSS